MSTSPTKSSQTQAEAFAEEFLEPIAADLDRTGSFPRALVAELARQQLLVLPTVKDGFAHHVETVQTISQACPAVATILNNHALAAYAIFKWGTEAQNKAHAAGLAQGEKLGALAIHESGPGLGLGPDALAAVIAGGKVTLNGKKTSIRNAGVADVYVGVARHAGAPGAASSVVFIAEAKTAGISIGATYPTMGLRGCPVADVTFENVVLEEASLVGTAETGNALVAELLAALAIGQAAQTVGIGKAAARHAAAAARHRVQFGHPIASLQAIQLLLAEIATDTHLAWHGVLHAAQLADAGAPFAIEAAMVQSFLGRFGQKILVDAVQIEGGMGICEIVPPHFQGTLPLARLFRDIAGTTLLDAPGDFPESLVAASL
jgi:butyryl-CoA dehydrogenase